MKGIFVKDTDKIKIEIHVSLTNKGSVIASHNKEAIEEIKGEGNAVYSFEATFRKPKFKDNMDILSVFYKNIDQGSYLNCYLF